MPIHGKKLEHDPEKASLGEDGASRPSVLTKIEFAAQVALRPKKSV